MGIHDTYGGLVQYWTSDDESIALHRTLISPNRSYPYLLWEIRGIFGVIGNQIVCETNDGEYLFTLDIRHDPNQ